jgi:hypothetical protein
VLHRGLVKSVRTSSRLDRAGRGSGDGVPNAGVSGNWSRQAAQIQAPSNSTAAGCSAQSSHPTQLKNATLLTGRRAVSSAPSGSGLCSASGAQLPAAVQAKKPPQEWRLPDPQFPGRGLKHRVAQAVNFTVAQRPEHTGLGQQMRMPFDQLMAREYFAGRRRWSGRWVGRYSCAAGGAQTGRCGGGHRVTPNNTLRSTLTPRCPDCLGRQIAIGTRSPRR